MLRHPLKNHLGGILFWDPKGQNVGNIYAGLLLLMQYYKRTLELEKFVFNLPYHFIFRHYHLRSKHLLSYYSFVLIVQIQLQFLFKTYVFAWFISQGPSWIFMLLALEIIMSVWSGTYLAN